LLRVIGKLAFQPSAWLSSDDSGFRSASFRCSACAATFLAFDPELCGDTQSLVSMSYYYHLGFFTSLSAMPIFTCFINAHCD